MFKYEDLVLEVKWMNIDTEGIKRYITGYTTEILRAVILFLILFSITFLLNFMTCKYGILCTNLLGIMIAVAIEAYILVNF